MILYWLPEANIQQNRRLFCCKDPKTCQKENTMSEIVDKAIAALMEQPKAERDRIAWEIIERLEDKTEWDRLVFTQKSQDWLAVAAAAALKTYKKIEGQMSFTLISLPSEEYLREDSYWKGFDELPKETRKLAERNYKLWQKQPSHPSLRFKKVHESLPIFSFRVGLKYRTLGVETHDNKIAWFWVGSFEQYQDLL